MTNTQPQAALLREAAQNALITLDGIASANPRDKADFETPDEWIAWAKSRARFAADALRAPVAQEVYAERILRQMLHEAVQDSPDKECSTCGFIGQEDPVKGCPKCGFDDMRAKLQAATPASTEQALTDERVAFEAWLRSIGFEDSDLRKDGRGEYSWTPTEERWLAWQARAALAQQAAQPVTGVELPDDVRVPLDSAWADIEYLIGRCMSDPGFKDKAISNVRGKIDQAKAAVLQKFASDEETVYQLTRALREATEGETFMGEPVVTAPPAQADHFPDVTKMVAQALVPLTDEQIDMISERAIDKCCGSEAISYYVAREVERAHGINGLEVKP